MLCYVFIVVGCKTRHVGLFEEVLSLIFKKS